MPVVSSKWEVAIKRSASGGQWITGGVIQFKLRNLESGTLANMWFVGAGGGGSLAPISLSDTMKPGFKAVRSAKPTSFEDIDRKSAIMRTASASNGVANIGAVWLKISTGHNPYGAALFDFKIYSAQFGPNVFNPSSTTANVGIDRHWGKVLIQYLDVEPEVLPDTPDPHVWPGPIPFIPDTPPPPAPPAPPKRVTLEADVLFGFDSTAIKRDAEHQLHNLIYEIERRTVPHVEIEGHADSSGSDAYNLDLSRRRAVAVKDWFVRAGAPNAIRYRVIAKGEREPIADNRTREGRARNRRVEIVIG